MRHWLLNLDVTRGKLSQIEHQAYRILRFSSLVFFFAACLLLRFAVINQDETNMSNFYTFPITPLQ